MDVPFTGPNGYYSNGTNNGTTTGNFEYPHHTYATGNYDHTINWWASCHGVYLSIVFPPVPTITEVQPGLQHQLTCFLFRSGRISVCMDGNQRYSDHREPCKRLMWCGQVSQGNYTCDHWSKHRLYQYKYNYVTQATAAPVVNAGPDLNICPGGSVPINATVSNGSITWSPTNGLSCINCPNPLPIQARQLHILLQHPMDAELLRMLLQWMSLLAVSRSRNIKCLTQTYAGHPIQYTITV